MNSCATVATDGSKEGTLLQKKVTTGVVVLFSAKTPLTFDISVPVSGQDLISADHHIVDLLRSSV